MPLLLRPPVEDSKRAGIRSGIAILLTIHNLVLGTRLLLHVDEKMKICLHKLSVSVITVAVKFVVIEQQYSCTLKGIM